jgi:hypothetical protein
MNFGHLDEQFGFLKQWEIQWRHQLLHFDRIFLGKRPQQLLYFRSEHLNFHFQFEVSHNSHLELVASLTLKPLQHSKESFLSS